MDKITKFSLFVIFSMGMYGFLTMPYILYFLSNGTHGIKYPLGICIVVSVFSFAMGNILTKWADKKHKERFNDE